MGSGDCGAGELWRVLVDGMRMLMMMGRRKEGGKVQPTLFKYYCSRNLSEWNSTFSVYERSCESETAIFVIIIICKWSESEVQSEEELTLIDPTEKGDKKGRNHKYQPTARDTSHHFFIFFILCTSKF